MLYNGIVTASATYTASGVAAGGYVDSGIGSKGATWKKLARCAAQCGRVTGTL